MKFLIDNNLSPLLADALKAAGHDAVQVAEDLTAGAVVVLHEELLRVRRLPMTG